MLTTILDSSLEVSVNINICLTIRKSKDTDDKEKGDNNQEANPMVFVRVLIIPVFFFLNHNKSNFFKK